MFVVGLVVAVFGAISLFGAAFFLLMGGIFAIVFPVVFGTPMDDLSLDRRGVPCSGELIAVETDSALTVNGRPTVRLRYEYEPGGGTRDGEILVVDTDPLAALPLGSPLTVEFLPDDPDVSRIQGGKAAVAGVAGAIGLAFGGIGLIATLSTLVVTLLGVLLAVVGGRRMRAPA